MLLFWSICPKAYGCFFVFRRLVLPSESDWKQVKPTLSFRFNLWSLIEYVIMLDSFSLLFEYNKWWIEGVTRNWSWKSNDWYPTTSPKFNYFDNLTGNDGFLGFFLHDWTGPIPIGKSQTWVISLTNCTWVGSIFANNYKHIKFKFWTHHRIVKRVITTLVSCSTPLIK